MPMISNISSSLDTGMGSPGTPKRDGKYNPRTDYMSIRLAIVSGGDWLGNPENIKVGNNGAAGYVGRSLTVHSPLFPVHKLYLNKLMQCFYWLITSK